MRILGLLGVLLWLGTLLANAGGAERLRLNPAVLDEWSASLLSGPALGTESADDAAKAKARIPSGFATDAVEPPAWLRASLFAVSVVSARPCATIDVRRPLPLSWHLAQGPPSSGLC